MSVGTIGVTSGAVSSLPPGAVALIASGFSTSGVYTYTGSIAPGRYIIEGQTVSSDVPFTVYAPNSNNRVLVKSGQPAVLEVTTAETELQFLALPFEDGKTIKTASYAFSYTQQTQGYAENTSNAAVVGLYYYSGTSTEYSLSSSTDGGLTWTNRINGRQTYDLIWSPTANKFIWLTDSDIRYSTNGSTWTIATGSVGGGSAVRDFGANGIYITHDGGILRSTDGITWTSVFGTYAAYDIAYSAGLNTWCAVGDGYLISSTDGTTFTTYPIYNHGYGAQAVHSQYTISIVALKDRFVWGGQAYNSSGNGIFVSYDGKRMDHQTRNIVVDASTSANGLPFYLAEKNGILFAINTFTSMENRLLYSFDGIGWTDYLRISPLATDVRGQSLSWINNKLVAATASVGGTPRVFSNQLAFKLYSSDYATI